MAEFSVICYFVILIFLASQLGEKLRKKSRKNSRQYCHTFQLIDTNFQSVNYIYAYYFLSYSRKRNVVKAHKAPGF